MASNSEEQLLSVKELAWKLNRHPNYVYLMRKAGFVMGGNRTTLEEAREWLAENPNWRGRLTTGDSKLGKIVSSHD
ncbi:hypothetical protein VDG1235_2695 [Verrucomicrobiia bacterium DG1235]|nr:hypothetical protein VDG1235_2695 [Verrucomicrobiae bacterium DG1235]